MSLKNTLLRVAEFQPRPFIAPIWNPRMRVLAIQDRIPFHVNIEAPSPGWWKIIPSFKLNGIWTETGTLPAAPWEIYEFLEQLPRFYVITLFRVRENTWLCVPYNASDAQQRGWPASTPREVYLVAENISPLMCVSVRKFANVLLYDSPGERLAETSPNLQMAQEIIRQRELELEKSKKEAVEAARKLEESNSIEGKIKDNLDFMGANLVQWEEEGEGIRVTWEYEGYRHSSRITRDAGVLSAGICLDGTDREHNLSALVAVIQEARELHRFDMPEESYI